MQDHATTPENKKINVNAAKNVYTVAYLINCTPITRHGLIALVLHDMGYLFVG